MDASVHFIFFDELSPIRLPDAFLYCSTKLFILFQQSQGSIFHEVFGVNALMAGDLRKLRFLVRSERDFHTRQCRHGLS